MNIKEIRKANLDDLLKQYKAAEIARKADTKPAYISQIVTGVKTTGGRVRGIGDDLARKIESGLGLPGGWMDQLHGVDSAVMEKRGAYRVKGNGLFASIIKNMERLAEDDLKEVEMYVNYLLNRPHPGKNIKNIKNFGAKSRVKS